MAISTIAARARVFVDELDLPDPLTAEALHTFVEKANGRRITIDEAPAAGKSHSAAVCGMWFTAEGESFDRVSYRSVRSPLHRRQIIHHEYAHILCKHLQRTTLLEDVRQFLPDLPEGALVKALTRSALTSEEEAFAEAVADELSLRMMSAGGAVAMFGFSQVLM